MSKNRTKTLKFESTKCMTILTFARSRAPKRRYFLFLYDLAGRFEANFDGESAAHWPSSILDNSLSADRPPFARSYCCLYSQRLQKAGYSGYSK